MRVLSHSEIEAASTCEWRHAFAYTGHLTDDTTLLPLDPPVRLREGRAWGRAVAALHQRGENYARATLVDALTDDARAQGVAGVFDEDDFNALANHLTAALNHYIDLEADQQVSLAGLSRLEQEALVSLPSRSGRRSSNRYRFLAYFDGILTDAHGDWLVEFKFRTQLTPHDLLHRSPQHRRYGWAWRKLTGREFAGIIVDERLNAVPSPVKHNKNGALSKVQSCTAKAYEEAGGDDPEVLDKLRAKRWGNRERIFLTDADLAEAEREVLSASLRIRDLDSGAAFPVKNPTKAFCPGCQFRDICDHRNEAGLIDALYRRGTPKRLKGAP